MSTQNEKSENYDFDHCNFYDSYYSNMSNRVLQMIRLMLFCASFGVFIYGCGIIDPAILHAAMYTNWALHTTNLALLLSLISGLDNSHQRLWLRRLACHI